jgi:hypothetical protein
MNAPNRQKLARLAGSHMTDHVKGIGQSLYKHGARERRRGEQQFTWAF